MMRMNKAYPKHRMDHLANLKSCQGETEEADWELNPQGLNEQGLYLWTR